MMMMILPKAHITLGCHEYFLSKFCTMNKRQTIPGRLEMVVGFLLVDGTYLQAMVVANLLALVVTVLQEVAVASFRRW